MTVPTIDFTPLLVDHAEVHIFNRDGVTPRNAAAGAGSNLLLGTGLGFTVAFGDEPGEASFTVNMTEPLIAGNPDVLRDAVGHIMMNTGAGGALETAFAFLTYVGGGDVITDGKAAGFNRQVLGKGLLWAFNDWTIKHEHYRDKIGEDRYYGWMSRWYTTAGKGWISPLGVTWAADPTARATYPAEFENLDPSAMWIAATGPTVTQPQGSIHCLRNKPGTFTLSVRTSVRIHYTADNYLTLWLNSELIDTLRTNTYNWRGTAFFDAILDPGDYTIAAEIENTALTTGGNPMAFLCSVWTLDGYGQPKTFIMHSDTTNWLAYQGSTTMPGVTVGEIIDRVLLEAIAEGFPSASRITTSTFSGVTDSAGAAWNRSENRNWRVGVKASQIIADLGETSVDFDMRTSYDLKAYKALGTDRSATAQLLKGVNLKSYTFAQQDLVATRAWVQGPKMFTEVISGLEVSDGLEAREEFLEAGSSASTQQANLVAATALDTWAHQHRTYTATFYAIAGFVPFKDFFPGDLVMGLDVMGAPRKVRVLSIASGRPDGRGYILYTCELRETDTLG